jgi:hypothetical protein
VTFQLRHPEIWLICVCASVTAQFWSPFKITAVLWPYPSLPYHSLLDRDRLFDDVATTHSQQLASRPLPHEFVINIFNFFSLFIYFLNLLVYIKHPLSTNKQTNKANKANERKKLLFYSQLFCLKKP